VESRNNRRGSEFVGIKKFSVRLPNVAAPRFEQSSYVKIYVFYN